MSKSADAFRTISEVAEVLETPAHVLRFWESRFPQVKPVKRAGGRRYYRPADVALLGGIKRLLHDDGMTIRGVQKILKEQGIRHVAGLYAEAVDLTEEEDLPGAAEAQPLPEAAPAPYPASASGPEVEVAPAPPTPALARADLPPAAVTPPEPAAVETASDLPLDEAPQPPERAWALLPQALATAQPHRSAPVQGQLLPEADDLPPPPARAPRPRESRTPAAPSAWPQDSLFAALEGEALPHRLESLAALASRLRARDHAAALPRESQHALRAAAVRLQALRDRLSAPVRD